MNKTAKTNYSKLYSFNQNLCGDSFDSLKRKDSSNLQKHLKIPELFVAHTSQLSGLGRSVWQQDEFG